jgi:hypothetical protein
MKTLPVFFTLAFVLAGCGASSVSATNGTNGIAPPGSQPPPPPPPPPPPVPGAQDFATRCSQPNVLRCFGFESPSEIAGAFGDNSGINDSGTTTPALDTTVFASGASSLKFTIPAQSGADTSGSFFTNFSSDLSVQFGANQEFYVQWRQRFSPEFINTFYNNGNGWKQAIITAGDTPGCKGSGTCATSCTAIEVVMQNTLQRKLPQMYNSCTGSTSHSAFAPLDELYNGTDFKLQNARPSPFCLYSQGNTNPVTFFSPGTCFGYFPNEWMSFQVKIKTGPRLTTGAMDEWVNSQITVWVGREGQASQLVMDRTWNLSAGAPSANLQFGKIWLLPYHTNKDPTQVTPVGATWYDDLVISRSIIADPQ